MCFTTNRPYITLPHHNMATTTEIKLHSINGEPGNKDHTAIIDTFDYPLVAGYIFFDQDGYPTTRQGNRPITLHRLLMGKPPAKGLSVDHINRNRMDNRRQNLRWATNIEQWRNRGSKTKKLPRGVTSSKNGGKYIARFRQKHLGTFPSIQEAVDAYNGACLEFDREHNIEKGIYSSVADHDNLDN